MNRLLLIAVIVLAAFAGYFIGTRVPAPQSPDTAIASAKRTYVCPMHPHIVSDHPGVCPICGMDLVAAGEAAGGTQQIHVDTATQQKLGVRVARAEPATLTQDIRTHATVVADEAGLLRITPSIDGVLAKLHVHRVGQRVAKGEVLYELSSAEALTLQYEYIDMLRRSGPTLQMAEERRAQNRQAIATAPDAAAREQAERNAHNSEEQLLSILQPLQRDRDRGALRLKQIGFTDDMIAKLGESRQALATIPVRARETCVVKEVLARPGMTVNHMSEILTCVDATRAWLEVVLYADQLAAVREGDAVSVETAGGDTFKSTLTGLGTLADPVTRTVRARLPLPAANIGRIGDYASVTIHSAPRQVLAVPKGAVIRTGHGNFVMRAMGNGHFMPVEVTTGIETEDQIAIREGLAAGDEVVVNGQFLLDAAASLAESAQRMQGAGGQR